MWSSLLAQPPDMTSSFVAMNMLPIHLGYIPGLLQHPTFLTAYLLLQLCPEMILEASHPHRLFSQSGNNISQMSKCGKHDMQTLQPNITLPYACFQFFFPPDKKNLHSSQSLP